MSYLKTIDELKTLSDIAVVPVGSLEQHGPHLPVSTDIIITQAFADALGEELNAYVLPCLPISTAYEHKGKRGSVWMNADTFYRMLCDIALNLKDQGFKKLAVIKGHGGIFVMDPAVRHLNASYNPELLVCMLEMNYPGALKNILISDADLHSGEYETSVMLHLRPELVRFERAVDCRPGVPRQYLQYGSIFNYCPDGVWGEATLATAEKGRQCFEIIAAENVKYARSVFAMMEGRAY